MSAPKDKPEVIDGRGLSCAFVLAEVVKRLETAGVVEVLSDHSTTVQQTVPEFCKAHHLKLQVKPEIYPLNSNTYRLRIER